MKSWFSLLRTVFVWLARIIGVIILFCLVWMIIEKILSSGTFSGNAGQIINNIVLLLFLALSAFIIFMIWWIKAKSIAKFKSNDQIMIPIAVNYVRGIGESWASYIILMTIPSVLTIFLFGGTADIIIPIEPWSDFTTGLLLFASNILWAIIILSVSYFLANNLRGREK